METVKVNLSDRSYNILIGQGVLQSINVNVKPLLKSNKVIVITDQNIAKTPHLKTLEGSLKEFELHTIILPSGEKTKSFKYLQKLCEDILKLGIDRKTTLIAFGGGVIGDIVGFAAGILLRGINFIQIPTTLLAMVDSSVGGKTAINAKGGKNLIGVFNQPKLVVCDTDLLKTLPKREINAGMAEVTKYAISLDYSFFQHLEKTDKLDYNFLVKKSCEIKAQVVAEDEKEETGRRAILNFGHTFGHALEAIFGYNNALLHGEAVSIGMVFAANLSLSQKLITEGDVTRITNLLTKLNLPTKIEDVIDIKTIKAIKNLNGKIKFYMQKDKKADAGKVNFILLNKIGSSVVVKLDVNNINLAYPL